ncbi:hypothetical protein SISNIDRAFT_453517 [Sistotremastrum niveocremeum HHB9708]|uniref:N-acetyltransferase domain-containing protein n=2 Tax=Sistotremastraceae TaxID=3402574 RepID=A0A164VY94_9AGAM|nr:hypothetical protein SISNIDRAFT_453517 [Sistotremastrum niveocremeum HHB9708]KZT43245.1 hypothetical protein SISSUDRAFT_1040710 [Sistotremastrum suecicum HHB10207 ss-3]
MSISDADPSDSDDSYAQGSSYSGRGGRSKRFRRRDGNAVGRSRGRSRAATEEWSFSLDGLLDCEPFTYEELGFEAHFDAVKEDLVKTRDRLQLQHAVTDGRNRTVRPLSRYEMHKAIRDLNSRPYLSINESLLRVKLRLAARHLTNITPPTPLPQICKVLEPTKSQPPLPEDVLAALAGIKMTPFRCSFASRLAGRQNVIQKFVMRDWESQTMWMSLLEDIHLHHTFLHPGRQSIPYIRSTIDYSFLQQRDLLQLHELLHKSFWDGINVSDALQNFPETCTVVARYKHLVLGAVLMSGPDEPYITYLVVRPGWDNAHIARCMLYCLIKANPRRDIILHVSATNPAMLLYNRFGFKAEEFIVGFYENYLPPDSKMSKNALRLRLRQ